MDFIKVKTRVMQPPKDDLYGVMDAAMPKLREGDIVLITSKVVSIHQGRCIPVVDVSDKNELIIKEAEAYIPVAKISNPWGVILTIKQHTLIPTSGIDESNANGHYVLWPRKINETAHEIGQYLKKKHRVKKLGVIITDSHTVPMRWGVVGVSIGFWGFNPLKDYRGAKDLFGRKLKFTQANIPDALSALSVMLMGEGNERVPIVIARDVPGIRFSSRNFYRDFVIDPKLDLYAPLLKVFKRRRT